jgi:hypothetical protein
VQEGHEPLDLIAPLLPRFYALGMADVAERLAALAVGDALSLAEAAAFLGLRSPNTVRGLVESGELDARSYDGDNMLVERRSAEAYLSSPHLVGQRRLEAQIWSALDDLF